MQVLRVLLFAVPVGALVGYVGVQSWRYAAHVRRRSRQLRDILARHAPRKRPD